ncbi:MAG: copper chaperone PCu(A)C [Oscillochloridaceae bacterium umkhey_bin13]
MSRLIALMITLSAVIALVGCAAAPTTTPAAPAAAPASVPAVTVGTLTISEPWVRPANPMAPATTMDSGHNHGSTPSQPAAGPMVNTAGYMLLRNTGSEPDALIAATADFAEAVELHTMVMQDSVMRMDMVERIEIPAGGEVALQPGGLHVMFLGLNQELKAGTTTKITLIFEKGGSVTLEVPVRMP